MLLDWYGYVPNAAQSPAALHGIVLMMSLIPAAGLAILAAAFCGYGLTEPACETIRAELAERRRSR